MTDPIPVSVAVGIVALLLTAIALGGLLARRWARANQRADMLVRELRNGRLLEASSILELRLTPARLTGEIAGFLDECWRRPARSAADPPHRASA